MRAVEIAIDTNRTPLTFAGTVRPVLRFGENEQETSAGGHPVWDVDCLLSVPQFGGEQRMETIAVRVPSPKRPELEPFKPVGFEHPVMSAYLSKGDMRVQVKAAGIAAVSAGGKRNVEAVA